MGLTFERLASELGKVVEPLESRLRQGEIEQFFRELGMPAPEAVVQAQGVATAAQNLAAAAAPVPALVIELVRAIGAEDLDKIADVGGRLVPVVTAIIDAAPVLAQAIDGAANAAGPQSADVQAFAAEFPERLVGYLVATYLETNHAGVYAVAVLFGLVDQITSDATDEVPGHTKHVLRLDRLAQLAQDPVSLLAERYGWGSGSLDWERLSLTLAILMQSGPFAVELARPLNAAPEIRTRLLTIRESADGGVQTTLGVALPPGLDASMPLSQRTRLEFGISGALDTGAAVVLDPPAAVRVVPPNAGSPFEASAQLSWVAEAAAGEDPLLVVGAYGGPRLVARLVRASATVEFAWSIGAGRAEGDLGLQLSLEQGQIIIDLAAADGFLAALLPQDGLTLDFDVGVGWSEATGLQFRGSAALRIDIPVDFDVGVLRIPSVRLELGFGDGAFELVAATSVGARLGPFALVIDQVGVRLRLSFPPQGGNLGVADLMVGFKPPEGVGLSLDAAVVKGGGFLGINEAGTEYAGVLELAIGPVSVKAIGILTTEVPGGQGWALLLLVFTEFSAVQLGYGFTLNGVGGIIGLQHGVSTPALQSGLRSGVLDSVLFPANPVANAPLLLGQLRAVFPITPRALVLGPVVKLGWSTPPLITISLGVVLQFDDVLGASGPPQLTRIVLLGQLKIQVPPDLGEGVPSVLKLLVDIAGSYELREQSLAIDAVLRDSHIAGLPLTGSLVVRARFGAQPSFMLAVGGFHPRFTDLPPGLPPQDRVGFQLAYDIVTVRVVGYTAVTSNSFQIGAEASLVAAAAGFRVEAYLGFDALFVLVPFHFTIDFRVGASIRYKSHSLASVDVRGVLTGPGRWVVTGHASFKVLFWRVGIDFEVAWGSRPDALPVTIAVAPALVKALQDPANWQAQLPVGGAALVTLRQPGIDGVLAHPLGELSVIQRVVPLGVEIDRVGTARPSDGSRFDITAVEVGAPGSPGFRSSQPVYREEHFARGEFLDLSEEQKLSAPSFERFRAGASLSSDAYVVGDSQVAYDPGVETLYLEDADAREIGTVPADLVARFAHYGAAAYSELRVEDKLAADRSLVVTLVDPAYAVAEATGLASLAGQVFGSYTLAEQASAAVPGKTLAVELAELLGAP